MSRLADIYKSEKKSGGGLGSTLGKAALEKIDPRKMFNQQGLMAAMLPSLFKAYSATPKSNTMSSRLTSPSLNTGALESQLVDISVNTRLTAKNTMVLPMMARDSNLTKLNIMKLVKLQGGEATKTSDMFWKNSAAREKEYESKFSKEKSKTSTPSSSGGSPAAAGGAGGLKGIGLDFLSSLAGGIGKGVGIAAIGLGIGGFFAGLAAGGAAVNALGGASGVKDMLVNLAEGLGAFSGQSMLAFGALLGAGMLFGPSGSNPVSGLGKGLNMSIGIASIGLGLGGFLAGLALGGAGIAALGGSGGVKQMMVDLAEGLNAFNPSSMAAFGALLATGGLFGVVTGVAAPVGLAMMGGTMLGMTAIGLGLGGFLAGLALGGKGIDMLGGGKGVKDMLVNLAEGLNAFGGIDAGNLTKLALAIPAFGVGLLGFFGMQGIAGMVKEFTDGMAGLMNWVFGNEKSGKTPMQQLAEDLKLFQNINGDNLSKIGQGFKDLASGLLGFAKITPEDLEKAVTAAGVTVRLNKVIGGNQTTAPAKTGGNMTPEQIAALQADPYAEKKSTTSSPTKKGGMSSSRLFNQTEPSTSPSKQTTATIGDAPGLPIDYKSYAAKIGEKESGGKYDTVNSIGYVGKYQFGAMALEDMGLVKKGVGKKGQKALDISDNWTIPGGKQGFLNNPQLQEDTMKRYTMQNFKSLNRLGVVNKDTSPETIAGYLASSHLLGPGGALDLSKGKSGSDAYGTSAASYYKVGSATQMPTTTLASASSPSSGAIVSSSSTSVADQRLALMSGPNGTTNINAPTTNTTVAAGGGSNNGGVKLYNEALRVDSLRMVI